MPRSLWNGTVAFGLVSVPIKLYSARQTKTVHFHEVHAADAARIQHRRFCSREDVEVSYEEVAKGFEVAPGEYVLLDPDDVKAAAGPATHIIDVEHFVDAAQIDPVFYERTYFVGAGKDGEDAYGVMHDALERSGRAAIGRFTFHNREYLAAIRPRDGILALHTLRFADEVVAGEELEWEPPQRAPTEREAEMAAQLLSSLHEEFDPERYEDEYREAVLELIERKAAGQEVQPPEEPAPEPPGDLSDALAASLEHAGRRRRAGGKPARKRVRR
jgi:DNA end-binding protein Ku